MDAATGAPQSPKLKLSTGVVIRARADKACTNCGGWGLEFKPGTEPPARAYAWNVERWSDVTPCRWCKGTGHFNNKGSS